MKPEELKKKCKEITEDRVCYFLEQAHQIKWMKIENNGELVMPHISMSYRVNHCPICGVYVRDIVLNQPPNGA